MTAFGRSHRVARSGHAHVRGARGLGPSRRVPVIRLVPIRQGRLAASRRRTAPARCRTDETGTRGARRPRGGNLLIAALVVASFTAQFGLRSLARAFVGQPGVMQAAAW